MADPLSETQIRKVAAEAGIDPRTVRRVLAGEAPRSAATARVLSDALAKLGHDALARKVAAHAT